MNARAWAFSALEAFYNPVMSGFGFVSTPRISYAYASWPVGLMT